MERIRPGRARRLTGTRYRPHTSNVMSHAAHVQIAPHAGSSSPSHWAQRSEKMLVMSTPFGSGVLLPVPFPIAVRSRHRLDSLTAGRIERARR